MTKRTFGRVAACLLLASCSDTVTDPETDNSSTGSPAAIGSSPQVSGASATKGDLLTFTSTSGNDLDPNGYTVKVGSRTPVPIGINDSVRITSLSAGSQTVNLRSIAANCTVNGSNPRKVSITAGTTTQTTFAVVCLGKGDLRVTTSTTGTGIDPDGYSVAVDSGTGSPIGVNGTVTFPGLSEGSHSVLLSGVAANCTVNGSNPQTVTVPAGGVADATFNIACNGSGDLAVNTSTSGSDLDPDGYTVAVDGGAGTPIGVNGTVTFPGVAAGSHSVQLSGIAGNCAVSGANPQSVVVPEGGIGQATFTISCSADPVVLAAGDIAGCTWDTDEATAQLLDQVPDAPILMLGDPVYPDGTTDEFANCYDPTWGRHKSRTHPVPGDHSYNTTGAVPYFDYFGAAAGDPAKGYYSFDLGTWHIVMLNNECSFVGGCGAGSPQETWLRQDLSAHPAFCTLVVAHHPRFRSNPFDGGNTNYYIWGDFYNMGVDLVLDGDAHWYERFAPQTRDGVVDLNKGVREIIVGTGGVKINTITTIATNSEVRNDTDHGILKLTLGSTSYSWEFVPIAGKTFADSGTWPCH